MKGTILISSGQLIGNKKYQEDAIRIFNDECIVVADGVGDLHHGEIASAFVSETAIWAYMHVRQRPYYWEDKHLFLQRIFRTSNLALWNKSREPEYRDGLASTLCVTIIGDKKIWIGNVGDSRVYFGRDGLIDELISPESQKNILVSMALGYQRTRVLPRFTSEEFLPGDICIIMTDGVADFVTEVDLRTAISISKNTPECVNQSVDYLLTAAVNGQSHENMSVCVIKKV